MRWYKQKQNSETKTIRSALIKAEGRGISKLTPNEIRQEVKKQYVEMVSYKLN